MTKLGKWALVTGAGRRIGRAIAETLAADGMNVHLHVNTSHNAGVSLARELERRYGVETCLHRADFSYERQVSDLITKVIEAEQRPSLLVNSASLFQHSDDIKGRLIERDCLELFLQVNAIAPILLSTMVEPGGGAVVNILDARTSKFEPNRFYYNLSKSLLESATYALAMGLAPAVRVNAIALGLVLPPAGESDGCLQSKAATAPLRRPATISDVTNAVLYFQAATSVTGQVIFVDSGEHL